jgi:small-conductance mechanosensitive channel
MNDGLQLLWDHGDRIMAWGRALLWLLVGFGAATVASRVVGRALPANDVRGTLAKRVSYWLVLGIFVANGLGEVGFDLSLLMGAAGIVTVAVGFASQTSASNVISGLFLLAERPLTVGDVVRVGTATGEVLAIDLLSVKLRTFDNLFVRVPNETVMKSEIVNYSRFPIRRVDLLLRLPTDHPLQGLRELLLEVADDQPLALDEPRPMVIFQGISDAGFELQLSVWAEQASYLELRNSLPVAVDSALRARGIPLGVPERRVHART